jgi:hypothetical protein
MVLGFQMTEVRRQKTDEKLEDQTNDLSSVFCYLSSVMKPESKLQH